jgi:hypothetical protein
MVAIEGTTPAIPNFQDVSRISFCTVIASASEAIHRAEEESWTLRRKVLLAMTM